jgi:hypothetical protein
VRKLINRISDIRKDRNLFIHGLWGNPYQEKGEIIIDCLEQKITPKSVTYGRMWASSKEHSFKLSDIIFQIEKLDIIIDLQNNLLKKIQSN